MPLNYPQIYQKIKEIGSGAQARKEKLEGLRERARQLLTAHAARLDFLRDKVEQAMQQDTNLRCAIPLEEPLDASCPPPSESIRLTLIAADGSQVSPDRHAPLQYCLLNVGAVLMQLDSGRPPAVFTDSRLLFDSEIYTATGMLSEEAITLQRDIAERQTLLDLARQAKDSVIALTDGPVELWGAKDAGAEDYRKKLDVHKAILSQLQQQGVIVAGYVDKPGADLLIRTLELAAMTPEQLKELRQQHPLRGVTDRWLCGQILSAGHRSAVFGLQSSSRTHYTGSLALHFFYLNVGDEKRPALVRVEIPKWVVDDKLQLNLLHTALLDQCRLMGARPYPYILHRAHETAVIKLEEKQQIEQMLALELRNAGVEVGEQSAKQSAKDLRGRMRSK